MVRKSYLMAAIVLSVALGAWCGGVQAAIDQVNSDANLSGWDGVEAARWNAQTFTPAMPLLTGVEFYGLGEEHGWNNMPDGTPVTAEIWSASAGLPDQLLATVTRQVPLAGGAGGTWTGEFVLSSPLDVSSYMGNPSSLFVAWTTPSTSVGTETTGFSPDTYANGGALVSTDQGSSWQMVGGRDMVFRTYGDVPEPAALGMLALGALAAARRRV